MTRRQDLHAAAYRTNDRLVGRRRRCAAPSVAMIDLLRGLSMFIYSEPVDMRKSLDTLSALATDRTWQSQARRVAERHPRGHVGEAVCSCTRSAHVRPPMDESRRTPILFAHAARAPSEQ